MKNFLLFLALAFGSALVSAQTPVIGIPTGGGGPPTGTAGGVLSGTYPNPGYAVTPVTPATLNGGTLPVSATTVTASTSVTSPNVNTILFAANYPGADIGAKVNNALAALPSNGGAIILPSGHLQFSTQIAIAINNVALIGQGGSSLVDQAGTSLQWTGSATPLITLTNVQNITLKGFNLDNIGTATMGIDIVTNTTVGITNVLLDDVSIAAPVTPFSSYGIAIVGTSPNEPSSWVTLRKCWVYLAAPIGLYVDEANQIDVDNSTFLNSSTANIVVGPSHIVTSFWFHNGVAQYMTGGSESSSAIDIQLVYTSNAIISDSYFEIGRSDEVAVAVGASAVGTVVSGNYVNAHSVANYIVSVGATTGGVTVDNNTFYGAVTAGISSTSTTLTTFQNNLEGGTPTVISGGQNITGTAINNMTLGAMTASGTQASGISPAAVTITQGGTPATTSYEYVVVGTDVNGNTRSLWNSTGTGAVTINGTNYNIVTVAAFSSSGSFILPQGSCNVYRTVGGSTQGLIGTIATCASGGNIHDTGLSGDSTTPPLDTSGRITGYTTNPVVVGQSATSSSQCTPSFYAGSQFCELTFSNSSVASMDNVMLLGYNLALSGNSDTLAVPTEPIWYDGWESNWNIGSTPVTERYIRYSPDGANFLEMLYASVNRTTGRPGTTYLRGTDVRFENYGSSGYTTYPMLDCNNLTCAFFVATNDYGPAYSTSNAVGRSLTISGTANGPTAGVTAQPNGQYSYGGSYAGADYYTLAVQNSPAAYYIYYGNNGYWYLTSVLGSNASGSWYLAGNAYTVPIGSWTTGSGFSGTVTSANSTGTGILAAGSAVTEQAGTAGTAQCSQDIRGTLKVGSCYLIAYANTSTAQTYVFPTAFSTVPVLLESGGSCGSYNPTVTSTTLTLPANASMTAETCNVIVMGQ